GAATAALDHAIEHFRPKPASRPGRRPLAEARAIAQQVIDLRRYGMALLLRRPRTFTNARWPEWRAAMGEGEAVELVAKLRGVSAKTVRRFMADAEAAQPPSR